jgi:hypothetical protein
VRRSFDLVSLCLRAFVSHFLFFCFSALSQRPLRLRGEELAPKKNRIGQAPRRSGLVPMRLAQVGLGSGVGLPGVSFDRYNPGQVRVQNFLNQKSQTTTAT